MKICPVRDSCRTPAPTSPASGPIPPTGTSTCPSKGLKYVFPDHNEGIVFPDGTAFIGYSALVVDPATGLETYSEENVRKTYDEIKKLSSRDAETYLELLGRYMRTWRQAFREYRYSPPTPWGVPNALEKLVGAEVDGIEPVWCFQTGRQLALDLFDSPELQILFMRAIETSTGSFPSDVLGPYVFVHTLALVLSWESASIVYGGTHSITHALQRAFSNLGGQFFVSQEVERAIIENGRAVGVVLTDGTEVRARKFVVSDLGVPQTCQRLIGEEYFTESAFRRTKKIDYDRAQIWWGNIAMHELPDYTARAQYPDLGMQPRLYMGPKDVDYMSYKYQAEIWLHGWPSDFVLLAAPDSIYDPTRAPDGKHTILVEEFAPPYRFHSDADWRRMKKEVVGEFLKHWQKYAPNMTWDNVIDAHITTPVGCHQPQHRHGPGRVGERRHDGQPGRPFPAHAGALELPHAGQGSVHLLEQSSLGGWNRARKQLLCVQGHRRGARSAAILGAGGQDVLESRSQGARRRGAVAVRRRRWQGQGGAHERTSGRQGVSGDRVIRGAGQRLLPCDGARGSGGGGGRAQSRPSGTPACGVAARVCSA